MAAQIGFDFVSSEPLLAAPDLVAELSRSCRECPLGVLYPSNPGLVSAGPLTAKIAVLADYPAPFEMTAGQPLFLVESEWNRWLKRLDLSREDVYVTHIVQCPQPPGQFVETPKFFRAYNDEITHCMHRRALAILGAMPNLEVVLTFGLPIDKLLLGGEPTEKSHRGEWFVSAYLPNVAIFCLEHPRLLEPGVSEKRGRLYELLNAFRNLYLRGGSMPALARLATAALTNELPTELNAQLETSPF